MQLWMINDSYYSVNSVPAFKWFGLPTVSHCGFYHTLSNVGNVVFNRLPAVFYEIIFYHNSFFGKFRHLLRSLFNYLSI